jgi:2'-5' RNA ligase
VSGDRARLFVALELPDGVRGALGVWRDGVVGGRDELRLTPAEYLHVTLCFLGWQAAGEVEAIGEACRRASAAARAPELALGAAAWLPARRPRVLAARLDDAGGLAAQLQASLAEALVVSGWYVAEKRPFLAHVTVARVRGGARVRPESLPAPPPISFIAHQLTLYRSHLGRGGARYEPLLAIQLSGPPGWRSY